MILKFDLNIFREKINLRIRKIFIEIDKIFNFLNIFKTMQ
jgi:hypothetical protein